MSDAVSYLSEPATVGKVVLHTTVGDLDLELFSQQAPQTCRTFLSLALRRAYDGCTFHRIERDFLAQTGDLATSALPHSQLQQLRSSEWYSTPLKPELHSQLRFNRRGLVGLARSTKPATAGAVEDNAQFFITLAPGTELTGTHTLFGKLTGDTLYNLARLNEPDVAAHNSGVIVRVSRVEVLSCPWPELAEEAEREGREAREREAEEERRRKKREDGSNRLLKRNVNALSFAADDEEAQPDEQQDGRRKGKGLHDVLQDDSKQAYEREPAAQETGTPRIAASAQASGKPQLSAAERSTNDEANDEDNEYDTHMRERVLRDRPATAGATAEARPVNAASTGIKQQIQQLTQQLFPSKAAAASSSDSTATDAPVVSALEQRKQRFLQQQQQQKRQRPDDSTSSADTMAKLARFRTKLQHAPLSSTPAADEEEGKEAAVDWVTASASLLRDAEDEEEVRVRERERAEGAAWMRHRLQFVRRPQDYAAEEAEGSNLVVFDPTGREGSREEVRMGRKGLGVESGEKRAGDGDRRRDDRRRDDRGSRHKRESQSGERQNR